MPGDVYIQMFDPDRHRSALVSILLELQSSDEPYPLLPAGEVATVDSMEAWLQRTAAEVDWVATSDGRVLGYVRVTDPQAYLVTHGPDIGMNINRRDHAEVVKLFVAPREHGAGVGRRLLETAVRHIVASGRRPVLAVLDASQGALGFYSAVGLAEVGSFDGEQGLNHVLTSAETSNVRLGGNQ